MRALSTFSLFTCRHSHVSPFFRSYAHRIETIDQLHWVNAYQVCLTTQIPMLSRAENVDSPGRSSLFPPSTASSSTRRRPSAAPSRAATSPRSRRPTSTPAPSGPARRCATRTPSCRRSSRAPSRCSPCGRATSFWPTSRALRLSNSSFDRCLTLHSSWQVVEGHRERAHHRLRRLRARLHSHLQRRARERARPRLAHRAPRHRRVWQRALVCRVCRRLRGHQQLRHRPHPGAGSSL